MALDASIYGLIRPQQQQPGPLDQYAQAMTLKGLMDDSGLKALQRQQLERGIQDEDETRSAYRESSGDAAKVRESLARRGLYKQVQALDKSDLETKTARAGLADKEAQTRDRNLQVLGGALVTLYQDPSDANLSQSFAQLKAVGMDLSKIEPLFAQTPDAAARKALVASFAFQTKEGREALQATLPKLDWQDTGAKKLPIQSNPLAAGFGGNAPGVAPITKEMSLAEADAKSRGWASLAETRAEHGRVAERANATAEAGRWTNDLERGLQVSMQTGATRPITQGGVPVQRDPRMTEDQGKATGWLVQADNAYKNMTKVLEASKGRFFNPSKPGFPDVIAGIPSFGATEGIANTLRTGPRQQFMQASSSLSESLLRAATGAGVNKDEAAQKVKELTPQIGDDDETRKQKLEAIPLYIESLKVRAGPGAAQLPGIVARAAPAAPPTRDEIEAELRRRKVIQ